MRKNIRKIMALTLCLVLLMSMSTMASAVTITWGEGVDGRILIMNTTSINYDVCILPATTYIHDNGTETELSYSGSFTGSVSAIHSGDYVYFKPYVQRAMSLERIEDINTITIATAEYTVSASQPSGKYMLFVRFACKDAAWSVAPGVVLNAITPPTSGSGTISHAPAGSCTIIGKMV